MFGGPTGFQVGEILTVMLGDVARVPAFADENSGLAKFRKTAQSSCLRCGEFLAPNAAPASRPAWLAAWRPCLEPVYDHKPMDIIELTEMAGVR